MKNLLPIDGLVINFSKGERDNIEMKLCFGNEKEPEFFFGK